MINDIFFWLKAVILGIVEGITEFLPISSTGHLILVGDLINFPAEFGKTFEVVIQLGAILAVVYYYKDKILGSFKFIKPSEWGGKLWINVIVAFLPAAVIGLLFHKYIKMLFSIEVVGWAMIVGAVLLFIAPRLNKNNNLDKLEDLNVKKSLFIGFMQCLSMIPGMSRSASTIIGGIFAGLNVKTAAEFSFFLAIPTMIAASGYEMFKGFTGFSNSEWIALVIGFLVSFFVALFVVGKFLDYLGKKSLDVFAYYRLAIGILMVTFYKFI